MNEWFAPLLRNPVFMSAIAAWTVAQLTKILRDLLRGDFRWERITGAGGMPSSHSAMVVATTIASGLTAGFDSPFFAISFVLSGIVMYDAAGVRRHAGRHARAINRIIQELKTEHPLKNIRLKELIGHSPMEVLVGALQGLIVGWFVCRIIYA
ncbi:MAG TPA: divergent PAP2 family protein [Negativicutes bacterium]|nr:divergent PAP2 family protein [Negativicutes bacterium]